MKLYHGWTQLWATKVNWANKNLHCRHHTATGEAYDYGMTGMISRSGNAVTALKNCMAHYDGCSLVTGNISPDWLGSYGGRCDRAGPRDCNRPRRLAVFVC